MNEGGKRAHVGFDDAVNMKLDGVELAHAPALAVDSTAEGVSFTRFCVVCRGDFRDRTAEAGCLSAQNSFPRVVGFWAVTGPVKTNHRCHIYHKGMVEVL